jgi:hypothetical protein
MLALPVLVLGGCLTRGNVDLLESELRRQELAQQELNEQLRGARDELRIARADADSLRTQLAGRGQSTLVAEQAAVLYKAEALKFNMLLTSGLDRDGQPGDEGLSVLVLPVDANGDLIKLVGTVELELLDLTREEGNKRLGNWRFSTDEVREHWHHGFLSAGYLFKLDWQVVPVSPELTLHAKLTAPDGRAFDATTQVKVAPPGVPAIPPVAQRAPTSRGNVIPAGASLLDASPPKSHPARRSGSPRINPGPATPRAGHAPVETSDNWTDQTVPRLQ